MKFNKVLSLGLICVMAAAVMLTGCGSTNDGIVEDPTGEIIVISREDGSGTRGAFVELLGIEQKNEEGIKIDYTTLLAEVTNSTAVMIQSIYGNDNAIGYISLGSMTDMVKAVSVDGVAPSIDTVKEGTYPVARPFNIVYEEASLSEVGVDFLNYVMSEQGQAVVEEKGYVSQGNTGIYTPSNLSGELTISGSSSVTPVMEKIAENYKELNPNVTIEVQQSDSTTGVQSVAEGVSDIGMASRAIKEEEVALGLTPMTIAMDGIVVVIHNENALDNLTSEQIRDIYMGVVTDWEDTY
ncbi:MAG: substrate-binding domain-containing protein [Eubacterium sp.]|nr:substrate-binding domain-containing protein [Eubacterium sp.]